MDSRTCTRGRIKIRLKGVPRSAQALKKLRVKLSNRKESTLTALKRRYHDSGSMTFLGTDWK
jgi:hypothetical protein